MGRDRVKERYSQTFTVPAASGSYAFERMTFGERPSGMPQGSFQGFTALVEDSVADMVVELWLPRVGASYPVIDSDYTLYDTMSTNGETWPVAGYPGGQIRVKSGGTAGTATISGSGF